MNEPVFKPTCLVAFNRKVFRVVLDFCYHSSGYGISRQISEQRAEMEAFMLLLTLGDQLGLPIYPSYYSRRILPYIYPRLVNWKRSIIRPKGLTGW